MDFLSIVISLIFVFVVFIVFVVFVLFFFENCGRVSDDRIAMNLVVIHVVLLLRVLIGIYGLVLGLIGTVLIESVRILVYLRILLVWVVCIVGIVVWLIILVIVFVHIYLGGHQIFAFIFV